MDDNLFNPILEDKVEIDKENKKKDDELRKEFGIGDGRSVGIRTYKESTVFSLWKILMDIIRIIATVIILILAAIGIISLLHPDARVIMLQIFHETINQITSFLQ